MKTILSSRGMPCVVVILIVLVAPCQSSADDLVIVRAESLNALFDDAEAIAAAVGQPISREMILGMGAGVLGADPSTVLAMDRPIAAVMPVEGMMMMQNGVVVAIPVKDAAAAIEAMESVFPNHSTEGELHTFTGDQGPSLYLTAVDGYVRVGGNANLVTRFDPLAGGPTGSTLSMEVFLETIAPMIEANLEMAKTQMMAGMESQAAGEDDVPMDPAAMEPVFDAYLDGFRWLMANTSSIRIRLDVEDGHVLFAKDLVPKADSDLAGFIELQKGGLPETAKLVDSGAAWYMAGQLTLNDEHRQALKSFVDGYTELMNTIFEAQTASSDDAESAQAAAVSSWNEFMAVMGPHADRWIECIRGDMVMSFDLAAGKPFHFTEAIGLQAGDECSGLVDEMGDHLARAVASSDDMSDTFDVASGPKIAGSESLVMTFDMKKMIDEMGQTADEQVEAMMTAMYGESMTAAMVTAGDVVLVAGGPDAVKDLGTLGTRLRAPGQAPSFSPLEVRPGMMVGLNLGAWLSWMQGSMPEGAPDLAGAAERLSGEVGRIPMGMTFDSKMATFDMAVSLKTVGEIAAIAREQQAEAAHDEEW